MVWSEPHAEPRASAGKLWARRLVTELRDLLSFRGKRSAGPAWLGGVVRACVGELWGSV